MANERKYLDPNGVLYLINKLKGLFVEKEQGKGLSTNDYTKEEKDKLAGLNNYTLPAATADTLGGVKVGAGLEVGSDGKLSATGGGTADAVEWANVLNKPTKVSEFTNDAGYQTSAQVDSAITAKGYQTAAQVNTAIAEAVGDITSMDYQIVTSLPSTGTKGVIYLLSNSGTSINVYDEYIYVDSKFEKIGTTAVDLSGYVQENELVEITNAEIDALFL